MALDHAACCRILGIPTHSGMDEARRAYRKLARRLHPDLNPDDSRRAERFKEVTAAYHDLVALLEARRRDPSGPARNPEQVRPRRSAAPKAPRSTRDAASEPDHAQAWSDWRKHASAWGGRARSKPAESRRPGQFTTEGRSRACGGASEPGIFDRLRKGFRAQSVRSQRRSLRGQDVTLRLPVDLEAVLHGGRRHIAIRRLAACPSCQGRGDGACVCRGRGRIEVKEQVRVTIPAGARPGARLRLAGKGTDGLEGQPAGHLYLELELTTVPGFRRDGADLHGIVDLEAPLRQSGGSLVVDTPGGQVRLTVPHGTDKGARFRLRGQGLPRWGNDQRGDLFLVVA